MKYLFYLFIVLTLLATFFLAGFVLSNPHGWDAQLYCQSTALDKVGLNPYLSQDFFYQLPWLYPPVLLNLFLGLAHYIFYHWPADSILTLLTKYSQPLALLASLAVIPAAEWRRTRKASQYARTS
jgi:hypothetical protein